MSTKVPGYENTVVCPYNKCHIILKQRIQTHLIKCEKQHPHIKLETCRFDITHRYPKEEIQSHENECPSRESFDRYLYSFSSNKSAQTAGASSKTQVPQQKKTEKDDDDWDD